MPDLKVGPTYQERTADSERYVRVALLVFLIFLIALSVARLPRSAPAGPGVTTSAIAGTHQLIVQPGESISAALELATPGTDVVVEPGEYREALTLVSGVRLVSRVPGAALLRLPASASEAEAAVVASGVTGAALVAFRIVGDATTPLGTGVLVNNSKLSVIDTEISGAAKVAIDVVGSSHVEVMASDVHDNPGAAMAIGPGASARVTHNVFRRNGTSPSALTPIDIEYRGDSRGNASGDRSGDGTNLQFAANVFYGMSPGAIRLPTEPARAALLRDNWFFDLPARHQRRAQQPAPAPRGPRGGQTP
jgi:hypothetical protein